MDRKYIFSEVYERKLPLWDFGWFSVLVFKISNSDLESYDPKELFRSLLADPNYDYSYMTPRESANGSGTHGPFIIEYLKPDDFVRIDLQKLVEHLHHDFNDPTLDGSPTEAQQNEVFSFIGKLESEDVDCYILDINYDPDVKKEINHDFFWIHDVFHEYALVQRKSKEIYLCVVGID